MHSGAYEDSYIACSVSCLHVSDFVAACMHASCIKSAKVWALLCAVPKHAVQSILIKNGYCCRE